MKKLFILLAVAAIALTACNNKLTVEQAEAAVMHGEKENLPLLLQNLVIVDDIIIDSIRITITEEPMQGYLYTTWITGKKKIETPMIVQVDSIRTDPTRTDYVQWQSHWDDAVKAYFMKNFGL